MTPLLKRSGYSLLELLMTVSLAALILTLGVPALGGLLADKRLRVEVDALFHAIHLARKESVVRRRVVTVCPSIDGEACDASYDWSAGWIMFANDSRSDALRRDPDEPLLRRHQARPGSRITANRHSFSLRSTELRATNGTVVFCDPSGRAESRAIVVSYTGRPRVARTDYRGRAYTCRD
jgi:type IV fimbrial biogenesis protein FimT